MEHPAIVAALRIVQQPIVAAFLFVGLFYFWLIPPVHFRAMLDPQLYAVMNWSMARTASCSGRWCSTLPAAAGADTFNVRAVLAVGVMFPQIVLGAFIAFATRDIYPYYDLCGRLIPSIGAVSDQRIGGIVIWIPPAMMSVIALLLVLNALRIHEDTIKETDNDAASLAALASRWTGR